MHLTAPRTQPGVHWSQRAEPKRHALKRDRARPLALHAFNRIRLIHEAHILAPRKRRQPRVAAVSCVQRSCAERPAQTSRVASVHGDV